VTAEDDPVLRPTPDRADDPPSVRPTTPEYAPLAFLGTPAAAGPPAPKLVPEDLRAPWGWIDLLLFTLIAVAGTFLLGAIVFFLFRALGISLAELRVSARIQGIFNIICEVLLFAGLIGYLALQIGLRFRAPFWQTIGWRPLEARRFPRALSYVGFILGGFLLAFVVQVASAFFGTKANLPIQALFEDRLTAALLLVLAVLMAPFVEETIFRGYIFPVIARSFGRGVGVVATGTLFGLLHAAQLWGGWAEIGLLVFVGIVFTYARAVKQTVLASYLLHVSYNFAVSLAFLVGSHWLRVLPPGP
jgi:membrane protease YdiL (CAAX protease family)